MKMICRSMSVMPIAFMLTASGCSNSISDPGPGKRVEARLPAYSYSAGETIKVTVRNLSDLPLTYPYGFCKMLLQRDEADAWVTVREPEGCALATAFLGPRQTVVQDYQLPADLPSGAYRLNMPMPLPKDASANEGPLLTPIFVVGSNALAQ